MKRSQSGISYMEVLLATLLIAITLVPMMEALQPGLQATEWHQRHSEVHFALKGRMETVLAQPFADLDAAATLAGSATAASSYSGLTAEIPYRVYLWRFDADNADGDDNVFTGGDGDILWVRVAAADDSQVLTTLLSKY